MVLQDLSFSPSRCLEAEQEFHGEPGSFDPRATAANLTVCDGPAKASETPGGRVAVKSWAFPNEPAAENARRSQAASSRKKLIIMMTAQIVPIIFHERSSPSSLS